MKLDNIIYDVDSLATAITEQWNAESEAFKAMYPSDTATALVNVFAGYGAMLQYMLLGAVANCYTTTAFSTAGIYQLAETLGNNLHGNISAQVTVSMRKKNFIGIQTIIPAKTQFTIKGKKFFNPSAIILPATSSAVDGIILMQGELLTASVTTSGIPNEKFYFSSDFKANHNYIHVFINGEEWNVAESFLEYDKNYIIDDSEMNTVMLRTEADGRSCIKVGDNQLATLPASGTNILIEYVSNDGSDGNIAELNVDGQLVTVLSYIDNDGIQGNLDLEIKTTSTAFGGANTQSLEILRYSSPYVFASGHRAVRRQDYIAMLLNECGYLAANVWGEYEEAEKVGAYDALMMNMVYYTGIKSFQIYPAFTVGKVDNAELYEGSINSTNGFWGSFSLNINNLKSSTSYITFQDSGAQGILFINDNEQDPRDSILPIWVAATNLLWIPTVALYNGGSDYSITPTPVEFKVLNGAVDTNARLTLSITGVSSGVITNIQLADGNAFADKLEENVPYNLVSTSDTITGSGFQITFTAFTHTDLSTFIHTNEDDDSPGAVNYNPIYYARSDTKYQNEYYASMNTPTLQKPVQIFIDFTELANTEWSELAESGAAITGFKLEASPEITFPGTIAMFATNSPDAFEDNRINIRNSNKWTRLLPRTTLDNPTSDTEKLGWTDWIATSVFQGETLHGEPVFDKYKYYVIEIYSPSDVNIVAAKAGIGFKTIKFLLDEDSSLLYYNDNGRFSLNFPTPDSPGPGKNGETTIGITVINNDNMPLWSYTADIYDVNTQNDYRDGNVLAYKSESTTFLVRVLNADTGVYNISINGDDMLTGKDYIATPGKMSLDVSPVYDETLAGSPTVSGTDYTKGEILRLSNGLATQYDEGEPNFDIEVSSVDTDPNEHHRVLSVKWKYQDGWDKQYGIGTAYVGRFKTLSANSGHGCEVELTAKTCSGISTPILIAEAGSGYAIGDTIRLTNLYTTMLATVCNVDGNGAVTGVKVEAISGDTSTYGTGLVIELQDTAGHNGTIDISSETNLSITAAFAGNRLDTASVNLFDQPTIKKYNHFTTYLEFQQPLIQQEDITVQVSLKKDTSETSGIILQNVKNALYSLFDLLPDCIGKGMKLSTIYTTVMSVDGIEWCKVTTPTSNIDVAINVLLVPANIRVINVTEE